ncbi:MAG: GNAT family N-acetyltransferase [Anaerolineales bacterium]|nr:GNAT family N-acetyltransferase [Anaerolineales bacterium]
MPEIQIRPTVASDISHLIALDHSNASDSVWQLELRRDAGQITAAFREVRLPRSIPVAFPHDPRALADTWMRKSMMQTAFASDAPAGYVCALEREPSSVAWVTDLVVGASNRRQGAGGALLASAQGWALGRGHRQLVLEMQSKNMPMIRLAQKFGCDFCGYNDRYYLTQDVTLFFGKALK